MIKSSKSLLPGTVAELRKHADAARDAGRWPSAAFFYSRLLSSCPADTSLWLQQGHMLKEAGLFAQARVSYDRAAHLQPLDPEPALQLAILSKIQGDFREAFKFYERSLTLGYFDPTFVERELDFLRRSGPPSGYNKTGDDIDFYLSSVSMAAPDGDPVKLKAYLGSSNYSYGYVLRGYQIALEAAGYNCRVISNPEYVPDIRAQSDAKAVHIGFYPPDGPRFLKGAYNITCIAWEFERLRNRAEAKSYHAFSDAASMLSRAQEVWSLSDFGAEAVRRSPGIDVVRVVPTPVATGRQSGRVARPSLQALQKAALKLDRITWVPLAISPAIQSTLSEHAEGRREPLLNWLIDADEGQSVVVFLSVFNLHDFRKQMKPMIEAFVRYSQDHPNVYLLLKASCVDSDRFDVNRMMFMEQVADPGEMTAPLVSDRVLMTTDALSRDEMNNLNSLTSYYVCTSHAEGQNLPLIEAMGWGVVPLSVDHTAMQDYITTQNAIVIPSQSQALTPRLASRYGIYGVNTNYVEARSVYNALARSVAQSDSQYAAMSDAAIGSVKHRFGQPMFQSALKESLALADNAFTGLDRG